MLSKISYQSLLRRDGYAPFSFRYAASHIQRRPIPKHFSPCSILYRRSNHSTSDVPLTKIFPGSRVFNPHHYSIRANDWLPFGDVTGQAVLDQGSLLRVVSWNIDFMAPGRGERASAAMDHLEETFGDLSSPLVIMLQEVHIKSLPVILEHPWIRRNFILSNSAAPQRYFTIMMVSRDVRTENWLRVRLPSKMERDILAVDIPISYTAIGSRSSRKVLRLCTTHLESLWESEGKELRPRQLALISALMKSTQVVGGLVGGDMNHISALDSISHKADEVNLYDVWEDNPPPVIPVLKPFQRDLTLGRARGNTWGYQSQNAKARRQRLDKFFYTGAVELIALTEIKDLAGKIGRLGIGLKTKVEVWEISTGDRYDKMHTYDKKGVFRGIGAFKEVDAWVSDHFGIAIGIRVR
jgi:tyrosyl-DNA phosphodiesterase 2